ncbi:MAG: radical SAM protein, partial [Proteobacteria bacterium]|nr:radical SAM protein [Pseudomonadota bacterium]
LYAKPYGLLLIASILKSNGHRVTLIDIPFAENYLSEIITKRKKDGSGEFYKEEIEKEDPYKNFNRKFYRFGLPLNAFKEILNRLDKPDLIIVTSYMTYWYPGVRDTILILRIFFPDVPIYLGGIYATLLPKHSKMTCNPDYVIAGSMERLFEKISLDKFDNKKYFPDLKSFYRKIYYIPVLTSIGCPYHCQYCASKTLNSNYLAFDIDYVYDYIVSNSEHFNTKVIAFLDDALLFNKENHIYKLLNKIIRENKDFSFYTPNGLHIRFIDEKCSELLYNSGFKKLRLSLEFTKDEDIKRFGDKTSLSQFEKSIKYLHNSGYRQEDIGVYILCGIRGQNWKEVQEAINYVYDVGGSPYLSEYSPVPGSVFFQEDMKFSKYDLNEPLYQNNSILPMESFNFKYEDFLYLKKYNREKRGKIINVKDN